MRDDPVFKEIIVLDDEKEVLKFLMKRGFGPGPAKEMLDFWTAQKYIEKEAARQNRISKLKKMHSQVTPKKKVK